MANIPITDNTTLLNTLKAKAQALPAKGSGSTDAPDLSGITAAAEDILAGKKSVDATGAEITGTMTNNGAWTSTKTSNGSVTIPAGYHNGSGKVSVNVSTSTSAGALDTPSINFDTTNGKFTATSKVKTSGYISTSETKTASYTITRYLGGEYTPTKASRTVSLTGKYCTGNVVIKGDNNLVPENIKSGISIFGVAGNYTGSGGGTIQTQTCYKTTTNTSVFYTDSIDFVETNDQIKLVQIINVSGQANYEVIIHGYVDNTDNTKKEFYAADRGIGEAATIDAYMSGSTLRVESRDYKFDGDYMIKIMYVA